MLCRSDRDVGSGRLVTVGANHCLVDAGPKVMNSHTHRQPLQNSLSLSLFLSLLPGMFGYIPRSTLKVPTQNTTS